MIAEFLTSSDVTDFIIGKFKFYEIYIALPLCDSSLQEHVCLNKGDQIKPNLILCYQFFPFFRISLLLPCLQLQKYLIKKKHGKWLIKL